MWSSVFSLHPRCPSYTQFLPTQDTIDLTNVLLMHFVRRRCAVVTLSTSCYVACQVSVSSLKAISAQSVQPPFIFRFRYCWPDRQSLFAQSKSATFRYYVFFGHVRSRCSRPVFLFSLRSTSPAIRPTFRSPSLLVDQFNARC
jgi:hypothetical protein